MYFPTTHWSQLANATISGEGEGRTALAELCQRYWLPLNRFIRSRGYSEVEAQDLTQSFLLHLLENSALRKADRLRGKFRSFLIGALKNFLSHEREHRLAEKRGGQVLHSSFDFVPDEDLAACQAQPDEEISVFDRLWALTVLKGALARLEQDYANAGKERLFSQMRAFLPGGNVPPSYDQAAQAAGMNVAAFNSEIHRFRLQFRKCLWNEAVPTVSAPHEIDEEVSYLYRVLMDRGTDFRADAKVEREKS